MEITKKKGQFKSFLLSHLGTPGQSNARSGYDCQIWKETGERSPTTLTLERWGGEEVSVERSNKHWLHTEALLRITLLTWMTRIKHRYLKITLPIKFCSFGGGIPSQCCLIKLILLSNTLDGSFTDMRQKIHWITRPVTNDYFHCWLIYKLFIFQFLFWFGLWNVKHKWKKCPRWREMSCLVQPTVQNPKIFSLLTEKSRKFLHLRGWND